MAFVWQQSMDVQTLTRKRLHQICFFHIPQWGVLINGSRCKQLLDTAAGCCVRMVQPESFVAKLLYLYPRVECCVQAEASHWLWAKNAICYKAPVFAAQSWIIVSSELNASQWSLGENSTAVARGLWPWRIFCRAPVAASQSPMVLSSEVDTSHWPLGENETELICPPWPIGDSCRTVCPYIPESNAPFLRSRCKPVPVGRECYGIDAAIVTPSVSRAPVATLHSLIVRFADGNARYGLLGENATALALPSASLQSFCLCIPDSDGPIIGRRYKTLTTGREFRRANPVIMTCKHLLQSSCPYVPNSNDVLNKRDASQMILGENAKARTL